ncbi:MAG: queuosine precursor transporter [Alkalispirochaeta sp.]
MDIVSSNEALWGVLLLVNFAGIIFAHRVFGTTGLYVWIAIAGIVANLQVSKTIELFGLTATLGNIVYAGSFLATDILNELLGPKAARRGVWIGFFAVVTLTVLMQLALLFTPAPSDTMQEHLLVVFGVLPRITAASLIAYIVAQQHDVWAYQFWRSRFPGPLWLRNNLSTIVSQLIDSVLFTVVAFVGVFPPIVLVEIVVTTYLFKAVVAIIDTPFLYLSVRSPAGRRGTDPQNAGEEPDGTSPGGEAPDREAPVRESSEPDAES